MKSLHCTLPLGPYKIKVYKDQLENADEHVWGEFQWATNEIVLNKEINSDRTLADTLIHECVEAINEIYGLELPHQAIQTLGVGLAQMLGGRMDLEADKLTLDDCPVLDNRDGD